MKNFAKTLAGFIAGIAMVASLSFAANTFYAGYNAQTNQNGAVGLDVSGGTPPVVTGSTGCGTLTLQAGGTSTGSVKIGTFATTCALTLTLPVPTIVVSNAGGANGNGGGKVQTNSAAAPNGLLCTFYDSTTQILLVEAISSTTTACSSVTSTSIVTGDVIFYNIQAF
jgi:hypothetical protein